MRILSGAIIILAAAILYGAGVIAESISAAHAYSAAGRSAMVGGVVLAIVGIFVVMARERPPLGPP